MIVVVIVQITTPSIDHSFVGIASCRAASSLAPAWEVDVHMWETMAKLGLLCAEGQDSCRSFGKAIDPCIPLVLIARPHSDVLLRA